MGGWFGRSRIPEDSERVFYSFISLVIWLMVDVLN